jgi:hypothetical protein
MPVKEFSGLQTKVQTDNIETSGSLRNHVDRFLRNWSESVEADSNKNESASSGMNIKDSPRAVLQKRGEIYNVLQSARLDNSKIDSQEISLERLRLETKQKVFRKRSSQFAPHYIHENETSGSNDSVMNNEEDVKTNTENNKMQPGIWLRDRSFKLAKDQQSSEADRTFYSH